MWRVATLADDETICRMCLDYYREDPGVAQVSLDHIRRTVETLRWEAHRGRTVVLDVDGHVVGYALLIAFWSNELGGEVCDIDEVFVMAPYRNKGHGSALFDAIETGDLWPGFLVALALGVTPDNCRARRLYERLGFSAIGTSMIRRLPAAKVGS